jgi:hypothetical protein
LKNTGFAPLLACALVILTSCVGVSADITVRADGSGRILLEYRVSPLAGALGKLDGNERWQTIPTGRADFERTLARLPGMRLVSFSGAQAAGGELLNRVELEFDRPGTLTAFLDAAGKGAVFSRENGGQPSGRSRLNLVLLEKPAAPSDPALLELLREVSKDYAFSVSFTAPESAALTLTDGSGAPLPAAIPGIRHVSQGKKVSFVVGTGDLLGLENGIGAQITW